MRIVADEFFSKPDLLGSVFTGYGGLQMLDDAHQKIPSARAFFDHPSIEALARAYVAKEAICTRRALSYKRAPLQTSIQDFFHFDDWKHRLKFLLFLSDVGKENAPMLYLKGSPQTETVEVGQGIRTLRLAPTG